jgi:hypothetical protein
MTVAARPLPVENQDSRRIRQISSELLITCRNRNSLTPNFRTPCIVTRRAWRLAPQGMRQSRDRPRRSYSFPCPSPPKRRRNVIARSALFAAIKSKDRRQMKKEIVASQDGVEISFSGEQLNQDDHDNFMQLVKLASARPLGQAVVVPANAILRALGRSTGKTQHEQLRVLQRSGGGGGGQPPRRRRAGGSGPQ